MILSILPTLMTIILALFAVIYVYFKFFAFTYWKKRDVVYEEPVIPFGNLSEAFLGKSNPGEVFRDLYAKLKKHRYFGSYTMFVPNLVIADPELIKVVLTKEFQHFHDHSMANMEDIDPLTGHLFLMKGKKWKNLRVKLTPTFSSGKMKMMFDVVKDCGDELGKYLVAHAGTDIDIKETYARYTTNTIMATAFGVKCNSLNNPDCEFRYWGKKIFEPRIIKDILYSVLPKVVEFLRLRYYEKELINFFTNVLNKRN